MLAKRKPIWTGRLDLHNITGGQTTSSETIQESTVVLVGHFRNIQRHQRQALAQTKALDKACRHEHGYIDDTGTECTTNECKNLAEDDSLFAAEPVTDKALHNASESTSGSEEGLHPDVSKDNQKETTRQGATCVDGTLNRRCVGTVGVEIEVNIKAGLAKGLDLAVV